MTEFIVGVGSALWLGVLTSISPCPLATNIAAISYIGRRQAGGGAFASSDRVLLPSHRSLPDVPED